MLKRILCSILCILMLSSIACVKTPPVDIKPEITSEPTITTEPSQQSDDTDISEDPENKDNTGTGSVSIIPADLEQKTDFNEYVSTYLEEHGYKDKNYLVSALSIRAALCLAILGAEGNTKTELLNAAGFESEEEMINWYNKILKSVEDFNTAFENNTDYDCKYNILNSIWNNLDNAGEFSDMYKELVKNKLQSEIYAEHADELTDKVNNWCDEKTNGLIPKISDDLSQCAAVLVNALYLKSNWIESFNKNLTKDDTFYGLNKESIMPFMEKTDYFYSIINDNFQIVVLPLLGDKQLFIVIGDCDLKEEIKNLERNRLHLKMPKFEQESSYNDEIKALLYDLGVNLAFDSMMADFSVMNKLSRWYIDEIIHKAKLKVYEEGLEAAAVTAIMVKNTAFSEDPIIELTINKPFKYYIFSSGLDVENQILLFNGQYIGEE